MEEQKDLSGQAALPEEERKLKWWQVFWGTIRRPGRTYRETGGRASLAIPLILIIGGTIFAAVAVSLSQQDVMAAELQRELAVMPDRTPEEIERLTALSTSPGALAVGAVLAIIGTLITWVIYSGVLHLVVRVLGGKGVFRQAFGIVGWAWIPLFFGSLVKGGYSLFTGNLPIPQGTGLANAVLANTDLFAIWNMVLLVIGFSVVYGVTKPRAAAGVLGLWLIAVTITYATGSLGQVLVPPGEGL